MARLKRAALVLAGLFLAILLVTATWSFAKRDSNCSVTSVDESWSQDRVYKATLLEKSCNAGESIFYTLRVDFFGSSSRMGWFVPGYEIENDEYPKDRPSIQWTAQRRLEVLTKTRTLAGSLLLHAGDDLVVIRTYVPAQPNAFPNYGY